MIANRKQLEERLEKFIKEGLRRKEFDKTKFRHVIDTVDQTEVHEAQVQDIFNTLEDLRVNDHIHYEGYVELFDLVSAIEKPGGD